MGCTGSTAAVKKPKPSWNKDIADIENLMYDTKFDRTEPKVNLNHDYLLILNYANGIHKDFMKKCLPYRFPNLKYIEFNGLHQHDKETNTDFQNFFSKCLPYEMEYLVIKNKIKKDEHEDILAAKRLSKRDSEIKKTKTLGALTEHGVASAFDYLVLAFDNVTREVFIEGFDLDNYTFALVLEHCAQVNRVVLNNCTIKIDEAFTLSKAKTYKIEYLDLFNSYYPNHTVHLNLKGLDIVARVMANTSLHTSLRHLHISTYMDKGKDTKGQAEQELFDNRKFKLLITADHVWPKTDFNDKKIYVHEW